MNTKLAEAPPIASTVAPERGARLGCIALIAGALLIALASVAAAVVRLNLRDEPVIDTATAPPTSAPDPRQVERGAYLARAGNCAGCHTARGGEAYAGGRAIETPFGSVYAGNLTPDVATGIGAWSAAEFWRALHNGRSQDGRLLYPAFPYPNFTKVTREDSDAIHAFLRSLPPVALANRPHALRFPYDTQAALAVWRALYFSPGVEAPDAARSAEWNRGGYLVRGLGHCEACHATRNPLGATRGSLELAGGPIPMQPWYAPSLASPHEGGVQAWSSAEIVALLRDGVSPRGATLGPMAEVVQGGTQHLSAADLNAMAVFLKALPTGPAPAAARPAAPADAAVLQRGAAIYDRQCVACHGDEGQGAAGAYPPLAGNRAVTLDVPNNLVRVLITGGFPPATAGNPRPYGMPPFGHVLDDGDVADVLTYVRQSWGNGAAPVSRLDVLRAR